MSFTIRRIDVDDGELFRRVRLAALEDVPSAFGSTFDAEAARPLDEWQERACRAARGGERASFFAFEDESAVGIVGGYREAPESSVVELVSMWVSPQVRRRGLARELVERVIAWALDTGAETVALWVTVGNAPAEALYRTLGFTPTGEVQPLPSDPSRQETRMERRIARR